MQYRVSHGTSFLAPGSLARRRLTRVIHHHNCRNAVFVGNFYWDLKCLLAGARRKPYAGARGARCRCLGGKRSNTICHEFPPARRASAASRRPSSPSPHPPPHRPRDVPARVLIISSPLPRAVAGVSLAFSQLSQFSQFSRHHRMRIPLFICFACVLNARWCCVPP